MSVVYVSVLVAVVAIATSFLTLTFNDTISSFVWKQTKAGIVKPGCAPISSLGRVKLHYFASRGRGEPIRLMLAMGGVPYEEVSFDKLTWPEQKARGIQSGLYSFGQVPAIETSNGVQMVQTLAIAHYIARATGMECDCDKVHLCEMVALATEDMRKAYYEVVYNPEFSLADREKYFSETLPKWFRYLEALAPFDPNDVNFVNQRTTWVDILVYEIIDMNVEFYNIQLSPDQTMGDILHEYPRLNKVFRALYTMPEMKKHRKNRFPLTLPYPPKDVAASES